MSPIQENIRKSLESLAQAPLPLDPDASLFDLGVIDSFGLMDVIAQLEDALGVKVPDADLNPRKFETISKIERYFTSRTGSGN
jgi:acyl carrier protein